MKYTLLILLTALTLAALTAQTSPARVVEDRLYAPSLENAAGEDPSRHVTVYLPPGYDDEPERRYPVIYYLHGFTWNDSLNLHVSRLDTLFETAMRRGLIPPVIIVNADNYTRFRGSWYTNSDYTGRWADFMTEDLIAYTDRRYRTIPRAASRGITGLSMGGYGALALGMQHPEVYGSVYAMSAVFYSLDHEVAPGSDYYRNLQQVPDRDALIHEWDEFGPNVVVTLGQAFSPAPDRPPFFAEVPYEYRGDSLILHPEVRERWRSHTLMEMAPRYRENLLRLTALKLDWGRNDEFGMVHTSRAFSELLEELQVPHYAEEYLGGHTDHINTPDGRVLNDVLPFFRRYLDFGTESSTGDRSR